MQQSTKKCRQCGIPKPLLDFYTHSAMADGHLNKCKECVKARTKMYADANPDKVRLLGREKRRRPKYKEIDKLWHQQHPEQRRSHRLKWEAQNRDKRKAEQAVSNAIRDGKLLRSSQCSQCGATGDIEAHHPDYDKPLDVVWLCTACHGETRHKEAVSFNFGYNAA